MIYVILKAGISSFLASLGLVSYLILMEDFYGLPEL